MRSLILRVACTSALVVIHASCLNTAARDRSTHTIGQPPAAVELCARAVSSMGGRRRLEGLKGLELHGVTVSPLPNGDNVEVETSIWLAYPDRALQEVVVPHGGKLVLLLTPKSLYYSEGGQPGGFQASGSRDRDDFVANLARNPVALLKGMNDSRCTSHETTDDDGRPVDVVRIENKSGSTLAAIERATGHVIRISYEVGNGESRTDYTIDYSDFRPVGRMSYPFRQVRRENGKVKSTIVLDRVVPLTKIDLSRFAPPSPFVE